MPPKFFFNNGPSSNELGKLLEKANPSLEDVLKHELLGMTVHGELKSLTNYFFPPSEMSQPAPALPHLDDLLDFALSLKFTDPALKIYQLNRNAANILAHCNTKFINCAVADPCKRVIVRLKDFIKPENKENNESPVISGHYQRILENYLRNAPDEFLTDYEDGFSFDKLIDFVIDHIHILPYRELLSDMMSEFSDMFGSGLPNQVLREAAKTVFLIPNFMKNNLNKSHQFSLTSALKSHKYTADTLKLIQPININKKIIPLPDFLHQTAEGDEPMGPVITNNIFLKEQQKYVGFGPTINNNLKKFKNLEQIVLHLVCLLSSIRLASIGQTSIVENMQNEESIHLLLICGVFSDSNSAVSTEAFLLLRRVLFGYDDIPKMKGPQPSVINAFAANFLFEPNAMTTQMFAAFPIFWNYRYETFEDDYADDDAADDDDSSKNDNKNDKYAIIDPKNYPKDEYPMFLFKEPYKKPIGKTPLEFLTPILLSEPPLNTSFNVHFMEILDRLSRERKELYNDADDVNELSAENKAKVLEIDLIYFEFLRNRFRLSKDSSLVGTGSGSSFGFDGHRKVNVDEALEIVTPLVTTDKFFHPDSAMTADEEQLRMHRVPLNGQILELHHFISSEETRLLEPSQSDPGRFYDFIEGRNRHSNQYFNASKQYLKLKEHAEKNAVIVEQTKSPPIVDELDVR